MPNNNPFPPVLNPNPVLRLLSEKRPTPPNGGGKKRDDIDPVRLSKNRVELPNQIDKTVESYSAADRYAGRMIVFAEMYEDRLRPTLTPDDLISYRGSASNLITSTPKGFLVETDTKSLKSLKNEIQTATSINSQVDISSIKSIGSYLSKDIFPQNKIDRIWESSYAFILNGHEFRSFSLWLMPFTTKESRKSVAKKLNSISKNITQPSFSSSIEDNKRWLPSTCNLSQIEIFHNKLHEYVSGRFPRIPIRISSKQDFVSIITSGTVCRIDPVAPPQASIPPGEGEDPTWKIPDVHNAPVVALVDGGLSAKRYKIAVDWRPDQYYVPNRQAAQSHGNQVASIIIEANDWNNNLNIPNLPCKIAPIQVVPKSNVPNFIFDEDDLLEYLDGLMEQNPNTKVWNFSFNQPIECDQDSISTLGHGLSCLARKHNILFVISAGNIINGQTKISPPADCDSALVVSGRKHNFLGMVDKRACSSSRHGLGPYNTLRPDLSWFSKMRVLGGSTVTGTSYSAPLVSRLAAHTFHHLKEPTPDAVRAIIINAADLKTHDYQLGWGTPISNDTPWLCPVGVVTLVWTSNIESGLEYHWDDIYIPPSMMDNGKIKGEILLTAILKPRVNANGVGQYYLSRLETSLQVRTANGKYGNLLNGCKNNAGISSDISRWNPIRVHHINFPRGRSCPGGKVRLRARVYLRDKYSLNTEVGDGRPGIESEVSFALTFICQEKNPETRQRTYDGFIQLMKNNVESAIKEQSIQVSEEYEI